jgi:hypothetical protein
MPSLDAYRWLIGDEAEIWLQKVARDLAGQPPLPAAVRTLRTQLGTERSALVLEQVELRARAHEKFTLADRLFFTRRGLEQATDDSLANYKAHRFSDLTEVADLCCGIGGDAMSLAQNHGVDLVDRDEAALLLAAANVERSGGVLGNKTPGNVAASLITDAGAWHIDPDRRASGQRTSRVELGEPGAETIDALRSACANAAVKLAPAAETPQHWQAECQREWIETRGECRQQVAWFGSLAEAPGSLTATLIDSSGEACSYTGQSDAPIHFADEVSAYLFDPSPSLLASRLAGALADALELQALAPRSLYFTGQHAIAHPHLQTFIVEQVLPLDTRQLRAWFQARGIGRLEIKKRGVDITPEALRDQLALAGENVATLILARVGDQAKAIVCRRWSAATP